jgi:hypothetical protein
MKNVFRSVIRLLKKLNPLSQVLSGFPVPDFNCKNNLLWEEIL